MNKGLRSVQYAVMFLLCASFVFAQFETSGGLHVTNQSGPFENLSSDLINKLNESITGVGSSVMSVIFSKETVAIIISSIISAIVAVNIQRRINKIKKDDLVGVALKEGILTTIAICAIIIIILLGIYLAIYAVEFIKINFSATLALVILAIIIYILYRKYKKP